MAQQYRLRLTEGTLLVVDHGALSSWLVDDKALVQPVGSQRWRLLKQFLADERAGVGVSDGYWDAPEPAPAPRRPRPQKEESRGLAAGLVGMLTGRKRASGRKAAAPAAAAARGGRGDMGPLFDALRAAEGPSVPPLQTQMEAAPLSIPEPAPLHLPTASSDLVIPDLSEAPAEARVVTPPFDAPPMEAAALNVPLADLPQEDIVVEESSPEMPAEPHPLPPIRETTGPLLSAADLSPWEWSLAASMPAPEVAAPVATPPPVLAASASPEVEVDLEPSLPPIPPPPAPAPKPAAAARVPAAKPAAAPRPAETKLRRPSTPAPEPAPSHVVDPPAPPLPRVAAVAKPLPTRAEAEAELEITVSKLLPVEDEEVTINRRLPIDEDEWESAPAPRRRAAPTPPPPPPIEVDISPELSEEAQALQRAASDWMKPARDDAYSAPRDYPPSRAASSPSPAHAPGGAPPVVSLADAMPAIRLRPAEPAPAAIHSAPEREYAEYEEEEDDDESLQPTPWHTEILERFCSVIANCAETLTDWGGRSRRAWIQHRPLAFLQNVRTMFAAWRELIRGWMIDLKKRMRSNHQQRLALSILSDDSTSFAPAAPSVSIPAAPPAPAPAPKAPAPTPVPPPLRLVAPPPAAQLPTLRFLETGSDEEEEDEDLYDEPGVLAIVGTWALRVALVGALAVVAVLLFNTRRSWLPEAEQRSGAIFSEIDKQRAQTVPVEQVESPAERLRALREAAAVQMPHLSAETIDLVMASLSHGSDGASAVGPLDVFRRAYDAAQRGLSSLPPEEADELQALRSGMFSTLRPSEQERVLRYEHILRMSLTLPFEDGAMMALVARTTSALPPEGRTRLQLLFGKAIAAGIAAAAAGPAAPPPPAVVQAYRTTEVH